MDVLQSGIYRIRNIVNAKVYIGSAKNFRLRWNMHRCLLRQGRHHSSHLQSAWNEYGESSFSFEVIERVELERLIAREQYWLDSTNSVNREVGYNARPTAESQLGLVHTEASKAKISASKRGCIAWNKGIPMSEEAKRKMIAAKTGCKHSAETIAKMISQRQGKKGHSAETRALMSRIAKEKGRKPSAFARAKSLEVRRAKRPILKENCYGIA